MSTMAPANLPRAFWFLLAAYLAASLLHFAHNAEFLAEYPNMPAWLTRAQVYGTWLGISALGLAGCVLLRLGFRIAGLAVVALYAAIGFDGLAHYTRAPLSDHTAMMNGTIWLEALTAALLLAMCAVLLVKRPS